MLISSFLREVERQTLILDSLTANATIEQLADKHFIATLKEQRRNIANSIKSSLEAATNDIRNYEGFFINERKTDLKTGKKTKYKFTHKRTGTAEQYYKKVGKRLNEDLVVRNGLFNTWNTNIREAQKLGIKMNITELPDWKLMTKVIRERPKLIWDSRNALSEAAFDVKVNYQYDIAKWGVSNTTNLPRTTLREAGAYSKVDKKFVKIKFNATQSEIDSLITEGLQQGKSSRQLVKSVNEILEKDIKNGVLFNKSKRAKNGYQQRTLISWSEGTVRALASNQQVNGTIASALATGNHIARIVNADPCPDICIVWVAGSPYDVVKDKIQYPPYHVTYCVCLLVLEYSGIEKDIKKYSQNAVTSSKRLITETNKLMEASFKRAA